MIKMTASMRLVVTVLLVSISSLCAPTSGEIYLDHVSTIYIPYSYLTSVKYDIDTDSVEQVAYDAPNGFAYVVGDDYLHIIDYQDVTRPEIVYYHGLTNQANDVAHCGPFVAYITKGSDSQEQGFIFIYRKYDRQTKDFQLVYKTTLNSQPEMLTFTPDCRKILTADEGTAGDNALETEFVNPEGAVSIIKISGHVANPSFTVTNVTFRHFNDRREKYSRLGVRFPYNGHYNNFTEQTVAQSLEPEYITINPRDNVAYIALQENNAIALLDLNTETISEIVPLGTKDWKNLALDPSDRDDAIAFQTGYDIKSFYMPDAIKYFEVDGIGYIATADEGSDLDYRFDRRYWGDGRRGESIHDANQLASTISAEMRGALNDDRRLGRLEFSITDGESATEPGKFDELFFFGGRGFSILKASDLSRVYDSGDEIEHLVARYYPHVFNSETDPDHASREKPMDLVDKRSDNRGAECETVEIGVLNGKTVLFVGVDHASVIAIYTVDGRGQASFESMHRSGGVNKTFDQLLEERNLGDLDPKDLEFIPGDQSPTKKPLLMVAGTISGTVSLYEVKDGTRGGGSAPSRAGSDASRLTSGIFLVALLLVFSALLSHKP